MLFKSQKIKSHPIYPNYSQPTHNHYIVHPHPLPLPLPRQPQHINPPSLRPNPPTVQHLPNIPLTIIPKRNQLILTTPIIHRHKPNRHGTFRIFRITDGYADGGTAGEVGEPGVRHVAELFVGVGEAVGEVAGFDAPACGGGCRGEDYEGGVWFVVSDFDSCMKGMFENVHLL